jgi:putative oxidoreductase
MTDNRTVPYAALVLRLSLGVLFLAHAALKVFVFTPAGTAQYFASLGLPPALAYLTMLGEAAGGVALVLGVQTRLISLALTPILIGAIVTAHAANGWLFSNAGGGWEFPAFWAATLVVQALLGDGAFALKLPSPVRLVAAAQS